MEKRRANLFTANSTPAGPADCAVCCVFVWLVRTHHLHLLRLFESNSLLRSYGDLFIYLFKVWLLRPATFRHFLAVFMLFLHYWSVKMKVRVESNKMGEGINLTSWLLQLETLRFSFFFLFYFYRSVLAAWDRRCLSAPPPVLNSLILSISKTCQCFFSLNNKSIDLLVIQVDLNNRWGLKQKSIQ